MSHSRMSWLPGRGYVYDHQAERCEGGGGLGALSFDWGAAAQIGLQYLQSSGGGSTGGGTATSSQPYVPPPVPHGAAYMPNGRDRRWIAYTSKSGEGRLPSPSRCAGVVSGAVGVRAMQQAPDDIVTEVARQLQVEYGADGRLPSVAELRDPALPADKWIALVLGGDDCRLDRTKGLPGLFGQIVQAADGGGGFIANTPIQGVYVPPAGSSPTPVYNIAPPAAPSLSEILREAARTAAGTALGPDPRLTELERELALARASAVAPSPVPMLASFVPVALGLGLALALFVRR